MSDKQNPVEEHKFWPTQPVAHDSKSGPRQILDIKKEEVAKKAIPTPVYLKFDTIDYNVQEKLQELTEYLANNYVGDSKGKSRFGYSYEFMHWWLSSQSNNISVGLRVTHTSPDLSEEQKLLIADLKEGELVGYISGVPMTYQYNSLKSVGQSVDFLCVHHALRTQNIAPLLIQEITRRSYKQGIFTAVFTAAFTAKQENPTIPRMLVSQYYHRLLNPVKLAQCKFAQKPHQMSERDFEFHYKLPYVQTTKQKNFRLSTKADSEQILSLLTSYQEQNYKVQQHFDIKLFQKMFRNIENVIQCFVYEFQGKIIGFCSFYVVDTQMLDPEINKYHKFIRNGYFYHYAVAQGQTEIDLQQMMTMLMHEMKKAKVDVCTCLDICKNRELIEKLQMDGGDGRLSYHTFNLDWGTELKHEDLGIVLV
ncbi:Glycylpeptide_N-tetradecanoyltransferase [Hexamita inflata]|uniref:Glycylpeptide N-tetradecanoyltransferase n=1 Tax=Hexamita inflata TaxID=28002 RepID=A0AA86UGR2_9EUKA|nr:Glycylpeptide N-tetradecanoyltransferase [Hexamita inflata]CAI9943989.1 Glycylpeptide N-tetradecanoyltransferase [Hexamita inflata]CAI9957430.1 Glycylpeptide N-tetradecanoyltransferase [Hexamita inflata]